MKKDPRILLAQILERVERVFEFTSQGRANFLADRMVQDAVIRNFEVMGEAAKRIPDEFRQENPSIPWKGLASLRDVLIHQYEGVNLEEVWRIVEKDLPVLQQNIAAILPPLSHLETEIGGED
jgi:uncharacterized protein with HEPN domain